MEYIRSLLLLLAFALSHCEPLQQALRRRSYDFGVYANEHAHDYEPSPSAYAAVPMHAPLPVIHIVSATPLSTPRYTPPPQRPRIPPSYTPKLSYSHIVPSYLQAPTSYAPAYAPQPPMYVVQPSAPQPMYYRQPNTYSQPINTYRQPSNLYRQEPHYAPSSVVYATNEDTLETEDENDGTVILYAQPQPHGGYTYRRRPAKKRVPPKRKEPVVIRVHKYSVVKRS